MSGVTTPVSGALRIAAGVGLLIGAVLAGYLGRGLGVLPLLCVGFVLSFVIGRWVRWSALVRKSDYRAIAIAIVTTCLVQALLVSVLYFLGFGIGSAMGAFEVAAPLSGFDFAWAGGFSLFGAVAGLIIAAIERAPKGDAEAGIGDTYDALEVEPTPLTIETFFAEVSTDPPKPATEAQISDAEARLGVVLPDVLKTLYRQQNGGYVGRMYVARTEDPQPVYDDWRGAFSIDYSSLIPVDKIESLWSAYEEFLDPADPEQWAEVPENAKKIVLLSQRYMDCTVLDYSEADVPKAGMVDYDVPGDAVIFDTFNDLFAALRRNVDV